MWGAFRKYSSELLLAFAAVTDQLFTALNEKRQSVIVDYAFKKVPENKHLTYIVSFLFEYRFYLVVLFIILGILIKVKDSRAETRSHRRSLKSYLDRIHLRYFCKSFGVADPEIRITYFQPKISFPFFRLNQNFLPAFNLNLEMEVRSSDVYQKSDVKIRMERLEMKMIVGRRKRVIHCWDGVVGESWVSGTKVKVEDLPDYDTSKKPQQKEYRKKSNLQHKSEKEFAKFSMKPKSIVGVPIRDRLSNKVGVLVVESKHSKIFNYQAGCNSANGNRVFTEVVFDDILENIQCIDMG